MNAHIGCSQQLLSACKSQARRAVQYTSPLPLEPADVAGLPSLSLRIVNASVRELACGETDVDTCRQKGKEDELQELADYSAALTIACAQALQTVSDLLLVNITIHHFHAGDSLRQGNLSCTPRWLARRDSRRSRTYRCSAALDSQPTILVQRKFTAESYWRTGASDCVRLRQYPDMMHSRLRRLWKVFVALFHKV